MDVHTSQQLIKALGYGFTHLIDTAPLDAEGGGEDCRVIYLYEAPGAEDLGIFGLNYPTGTDAFGDEAWCNATYDAIDALAVTRPAGTPLGYLVCTPMRRPDPQELRAFWYAIGMELQNGLKVTMVEEAEGPFTVKPVQQEAMTGMLDQLSESLR